MSKQSTEKQLQDLLIPGQLAYDGDWKLSAFLHHECLSYVLYHLATHELIVVDPRRDDVDLLRKKIEKLGSTLCLAVIDTHTHADHISGGFELANALGAPLIVSELSPAKRAHIKVLKNSLLVTQAGPVHFLSTPGHTPDSMCVIWGPFVFTGDTVLFGDVGRDDLPGGSPADHYDSLMQLRAFVPDSTLVLPGHDNKGGRVSTWKHQLQINSSLTQEKEDYVRESSEFSAPAPALLKESLFENLK